MVLKGVDYKEGNIEYNNRVLSPKNGLSKDIVLGFYKAAESAVNEGCIVFDESKGDSHSYTIVHNNGAEPKLNIIYISGNRNYVASLILNNTIAKVSGLESVIKQVSANLKNPQKSIKEKKKSIRMPALDISADVQYFEEDYR